MSLLWPLPVLIILLMYLFLSVSQTQADSYTMRFSDASNIISNGTENTQPFRLQLGTSPPEAEGTPASGWLKKNGWKLTWPRFGLGKSQGLTFGGPTQQRYLRVDADDAYYIWTHKLKLDPKQYPILEITWGVDRFPHQAAMDIHKRNDCPIVIIVSFGEKLPATRMLPGLPRGLAFFWDEASTVGNSYTCVIPRNGPTDKHLQCIYPHVKYIPLRNGAIGTQHTERVNLIDHFRHRFPDYWQKHQQLPPIVAVSLEARAHLTDSVSNARLYALSFTSPVINSLKPESTPSSSLPTAEGTKQ